MYLHLDEMTARRRVRSKKKNKKKQKTHTDQGVIELLRWKCFACFFLFFFLKVMIQTTAHAQHLYFLHVKHVGSAADLSPATAARKTVSPFDQQTHANYLWYARRDRQLQLRLLIGDAMQHLVTDAASVLGIQHQPSKSTTYTRNPGPETTVCLFVFCHRQTQYWDTRLFTVYEQRHSLLGCQKKGPKQLDKHSHTPDTHKLTHTPSLRSCMSAPLQCTMEPGVGMSQHEGWARSRIYDCADVNDIIQILKTGYTLPNPAAL